MSRGTRNPKQIRKEMARTREDIDQTVDRIQEKVHSENLKNLAKVGMKKARQVTEHKAGDQLEKVSRGIDSAGNSISRFARQNPLLTAAIGLGIGLLLRAKTDHHTNTTERKFS